MKSLIVFLLFSVSFFYCSGQEKKEILYSEFEDWVLGMDAKEFKNISVNESNLIWKQLSRIKGRTLKDPSKFKAIDYLDAMILLLLAKHDNEIVEMAFEKMIEKEGNCDYIIRFYDDLMKYDLYKPIRSKWSKRYLSCKNGLAVIVNERSNLKKKKIIKKGDFDLFEIGILEVNPGYNKVNSEFSKEMVDKMSIGVSKKLFISQNRFVEINLNMNKPKSFILYDYDIAKGTLSIYLKKGDKRVRAEIQKKQSLAELLDLDKSNLDTDKMITKSLKELNTYQVKNFEIDTIGFQIVQGYYSNKFIKKGNVNSQNYEEYWGLINIPSIKDFILEDISSTFLPIKFYSIDEFLEIKGGIHLFKENIDLPPEYKLSKNDYSLVSWKQLVKELKS